MKPFFAEMEIESDKLHIAVFGRANVGKSLLINCIFNQGKFKIDHTPGTITESNGKPVALLPNDSAAIIDIIVIDDKADFNRETRAKAEVAISKAVFSIIVLDAREELYKSETELINFFQKTHTPFLVAVNKIEFGVNLHLLTELDALEVTYFELSCKENAGIENFRKKLIHMLPNEKHV